MRRALVLLLPLLALTAACGEDKTDEGEETDPSTEEEDTDASAEDEDSGDPDEDGEEDEEDEDDGEEDEVGEEGVGPADAWAQAGCDQLVDGGDELILGASSSEANTAVVVADEEGVWSLQMPASGDGWFIIEIPDWMTVMRVFTEEGVELEIIDSDPFTDALVNGACPDEGISDQRVAFHEWGAYTVRVSEGAPESVWFAIAKEQ